MDGYGMGTAAGSDVPIEHLDYGYISKCKNSKELEKILKVLRSKSEGYYPDLIKCAENHLSILDPHSKLLIKPQNVKRTTDLPGDQLRELTTDLEQWEQSIARDDSSLSQQPSSDVLVDEPPVRPSCNITAKSKTKASLKSNPKADKKIKPRDYTEWDKFDVKGAMKEDEIKKQEDEQKKKQKLQEGLQARAELTDKEHKLSPIEKQRLSVREKDKGNESFKTGDYEEAMIYYSRSIKLSPCAPAYNNRALVAIKLGLYSQAASDCNKVLQREPNNAKALLRRATANESLKKYKVAMDDVESVLKLEPNNKRAQELLNKLHQHCSPQTEEASATEGKKGKRITIAEVESDETVNKSEVVDEKSRVVADDDNLKLKEGIEAKEEPKLTEENEKVESKEPAEAENSEKEETQMKDDESNEGSNPEITSSDSQKQECTAGAITMPLPIPLPSHVQELKDAGNSYFRSGQYGNAVDQYSTAIELLRKESADHAHSIATLLCNRAACHLKNGNCHSCIEDCNASISLLPLNLKAFMRRAAAYEAMEKYRHAFNDYQLAVRIDGRVEAAYAACTRIIPILRDLDGNNWRDKLPRNSDSERVLMALSNSQASTAPPPTIPAQSETLSHDIPVVDTPTIPPLSESVTIKETPITDSATIQQQFEDTKSKGNAFVKRGKYLEAIQCYSSCIELMPHEIPPYTNRALCYLKLEKYTEAEQDCTTVLSKEKDNVKALYRRALARKGLRNYQDALKDIKTVGKLDHNNSTAQKEEKAIHDLFMKELRGIQRKQDKKPPVVKNGNKSPPKTENSKPSDSPKKSSASSDVKTTQGARKDGKRKKVAIQEVNEEKDKRGITRPLEVGQPTENGMRDDGDPVQSKLSQIRHEDLSVTQFIQKWNSVPRSASPFEVASLLLQISPSLLPQVITNKLEGHTLTSIITALEQCLLPEGLYQSALDIITALPQCTRFSFVSMFLSENEKQTLSKILTILQTELKVSKDDMERLTLLYKI